MDDIDINLINIYAPNNDTDRRQFYSDLEKYLVPENNILAGDFNSIENPRLDKIGGSIHTRQTATRILSEITARNNLHDIWCKVQFFIFSSEFSKSYTAAAVRNTLN